MSDVGVTHVLRHNYKITNASSDVEGLHQGDYQTNSIKQQFNCLCRVVNQVFSTQPLSTAAMTYTLFVGNKRYSSWSMRPWVLLKALNISFEEKLQIFQQAQRQTQFLAFSPTGKVPCLYDGGASKPISVWDSLAIVEYIAEAHPSVWPSDVEARAFARCATAEMHSGFSAILNECSFNVGVRIEMEPPGEAFQRNVTRLDTLFQEGLERFGGPWLAGSEFTAVDAFFSPIASRFKTYGVKLEGPSQAYLNRLFEHPSVRQWVQDGIKETAREQNHEDECLKDGRKLLEDLSASTV